MTSLPNRPHQRVFFGAIAALGVAMAALFSGLSPSGTSAGGTPVVAAPFSIDYTTVALGSVSGMSGSYAGITFPQGNTDTLLIGSAGDGAIYSIGVNRNASGQITGFSGSATPFADAASIDGGLAYGPDGVLFYTTYSGNEIGQIMTGSTAADKTTHLTPLGVTPSTGSLNFVPPGLPGAGQLKVTSYDGGDWYSLTLSPDGAGTFNITSAQMRADLPSGSEGFVFLTPGSPGFGDSPKILLANYNDDEIHVYSMDVNGDPIPGTRQTFLTNIAGPVGMTFDPLTSDLLVTEYDDDRVIIVRGFASPATPTPTPSPTPTPAPEFPKGDVNCDSAVNTVDALQTLRYVAGLNVIQQPGCPEIGSAIPAGNGPELFGDQNCDGAVNSVDALLILRFVAALPITPPEGCPPTGTGLPDAPS